MESFLLRPVRPGEMETIYGWRNRPDVRALMPSTNSIDSEVYRTWWPTALADSGRRMMMVQDVRRGRPAAVVVFMDVRPGASAKWGFYTEERSAGSRFRSLRTWFACEFGGIAYALEHLRVKELFCEVLETHRAVLRLHRRAGFETVGSQLAGERRFLRLRLTLASYGPGRAESIGWREDFRIQPDPRDVS